MEFLVEIAIVGILSAVAIPQYSRYVMKARISELKRMIAPLKFVLEQCINESGSVAGCEAAIQSGEYDRTRIGGGISGTSVGSDAVFGQLGDPNKASYVPESGAIHIFPQVPLGIEASHYGFYTWWSGAQFAQIVMTPIAENGMIRWELSYPRGDSNVCNIVGC